MKLIVVISALNKGGVERVLSTLSKEWSNTFKLKIVVFDGKNIKYDFDADIVDLKLPSLKSNFLKVVQLFRRFFSLTKLFVEEKPDRIISFMESANFPTIGAAFLTGKLKKLLISIHTDPSHMLKLHRLLIPFIYFFPYQIITPSKGVSTALVSMGIPKKKIKTIYNPLPNFKVCKIKTLPMSLMFPKKYILGVGRLDKNKGFDILIEAFSNINDPNLSLVIIGEGPERDKLESIILRKDLSRRIYLHGLVDNIWPWYQHAKCFVSSSLTETWGNAIIEAMSQKCPVVAFDCDYGPREIITNGSNGLLVKINDINSLTSAISSIISDNQLSKNLSINGYKRSLEFDPKKLSIEWIQDV